MWTSPLFAYFVVGIVAIAISPGSGRYSGARHQATVSDDRSAIHVSGIVTGEKHGDCRDVVRPPDTLERRRPLHTRARFVGKRLQNRGRADHARTDAIRPYAARP